MSYVLSFDDSTVIPAIHKPNSTLKPNYEQAGKRCCSSSLSSSKRNHNFEPRKKARSFSESVDHIMAERKRRQQLTERFIALSATIPGLKKMDKASILEEAIKYVKQLEERVRELEKQNKKTRVESVTSIKKFEANSDEWYEVNEMLPEIDARVLEKEVLIGIHCEKQNGIEFKILALLQNLHLSVTSSSVLPFGNSTLGITIIAQMGDEYRMTVNDVVKNLRRAFLESHDHDDPY